MTISPPNLPLNLFYYCLYKLKMAERPKRIIKENKNFNEKDFESYDEEDDEDFVPNKK